MAGEGVQVVEARGQVVGSPAENPEKRLVLWSYTGQYWRGFVSGAWERGREVVDV
ncbi:hypothetical protein GWI33_001655, partial [Rhynchophorus ferrugineus]